jgi:hypothetical protein
MSDTILPGIDGDLIDGTVGDDTLFGTISDDTVFAWAQEFVGPEPDTETIVLDGRLWRIVRGVGGATVVDGATRRLIEVEEV